MPFEGYNEEEHGPPPTGVENLDLSKVRRRIVSDKPRVTRFAINWAGEGSKSGSEVENMEQDDVQMMEGNDDNHDMKRSNENAQTMFSSPTRNDVSCPQNVVSPDASISRDVLMSM